MDEALVPVLFPEGDGPAEPAVSISGEIHPEIKIMRKSVPDDSE